MDDVWTSEDRSTVASLYEQRLDSDPSGEYLDVCGTKLSAADVVTDAWRVATVLDELGVAAHERVATILENSPAAVIAWAGIVLGGRVAVPVNTAYKGYYLRHQLHDCGARVVVVAKSLASRLADVAGPDLPGLDHVIVVEDAEDPTSSDGEPDTKWDARLSLHPWEEVLSSEAKAPGNRARGSDLATFIYTGGTTGPSKGCMLTHHYHAALARQIALCWGRTSEDVAWTPLPMYHFNALTTVVIGTLLSGGRGAIYRRFSVSNFWSEMNRVGATITSTLGSMTYLLAHDIDRPEMPLSGQPQANRTLRLVGAVPMPPEVDEIIRSRFGVTTFSGAYGVTEASLISWQPPGIRNKPGGRGRQ